MDLTQQHFDKVVKKLATKDDLLELATKGDISSLKQDLSDIKTQINTLSKRTHEDDSAIMKVLEKLKTRVSILEKNFKTFKLQQAS